MSFKLSSVVWQLAKIDEDNKELSPLANAERKIEDDETVVSVPGGSPPPLSPSNSVSSIASTVLLEEEDLNYSEALKQFIDFTPPQSPVWKLATVDQQD